MELITAFSIGLLGSLHCIGMCGPIAFALPLNRKNNFTLISGGLLYNFGRLATYFSLGLIFGVVGYGFSLAGFQRWVSISVGIIMMLSVILPRIKSTKFKLSPTFSLWIGKLKGSLGKKLGKQSYQNLFSIGLLNGLLPCGLVYIAIAGSAAMVTPIKGGIFMLAFGLGTIPLMLLTSVFGNQLKNRLLMKSRIIIPVFVFLIGGLFILRGLNLGIPYLSPKIEKESKIVKCH